MVKRAHSVGVGLLLLSAAVPATTHAIDQAQRVDAVAPRAESRSPTLGATAIAPPPAPPAPLDNPLLRASIAGELDRAAAILAAEERQAREEYDTSHGELLDTERRIILETRAYVRLTRAGLLPISAGLDHLLERAARMARLKHSLEQNLRKSRALSKKVVDLGQKLANLQKQRGPLAPEQLERIRARLTMEEAKERALAFERAFATSQAPGSGHTAVYGAPAGGAVASTGFSTMKGRLPFPVAGRAEIILAKRPSGGGPGLELRVPAGAEVQAVFPGRVVFADRYADYGRTVILDHGDGYFSVSAGLERVAVTVGQDLSFGARVGLLGNEGGRASLYFELRQSGDPIEPAPWFGL